MTKLTNKDLLNGLRSEMSSEYQSRIPLTTQESGGEILQTLLNYSPSKNELITTLFNKVGKELFFSKVFNNPFKLLHKGFMPFGRDIQEMFVELAEVKNFNEHFTGSNTNEGDLIKVLQPSVKVEHIVENVKYKFKTSVSDSALKTAFMDKNGLSSMTTQIINSLYSSVECQEYETVKNFIHRAVTETKKVECIVHCTDSRQDLAKNIRLYTSKLRFPSIKYNMANVKTFSNKSDLMLYATSETIAELDVYTLAHAFNIDKTDVPIHVIEVDELPMVGGKNTLCVIADKDLIQIYDTVNETTSFYNGDQLATNMFAHKHSTVGLCKFASCVILTD